MTQSNRISGGLIDRSRTLDFSFDGRSYQGHPGDTLASALLANGVRLMGRSFKYHRPRGPFTAGSEEPNALVELGSGARREPNSRATTAELHDGLEAASQNRWPSLKLDAMAVNDLIAPFIGAGFYYKTFMWPRAFWERLYEPLIRRAAGLGSLSRAPDPDDYDRGFLHCDLLVVGAGPSGLMAALTAGRAGARVILADEDFRPGGRLNAETFAIDDRAAAEWAASAVEELSGLANVRLMPRTTVIGSFDHGVYGALERDFDHVAGVPAGRPRQTMWRIRAGRALVCAGAIERPIAFADNDRPGIMLAGSLRAYANRWAALAGRDVAIFTGNDDGLRTAGDLIAKGCNVVAVIDSRPDGPAVVGAEHFRGAAVVGSRGRLGLGGVTVRLASGEERRIDCSALAVSGGWNPNVHLTCHHRGRPVWDAGLSAFVPGDDLPAGMRVAGAAAGAFSTHAALVSGADQAVAALGEMGIAARAGDIPEAEDAPVSITPLWHVSGSKGRAWIDLQNDVTVKDIALAHRENYRSVEHMKRYTTLGMATDQGKTSNLPGLAVMAGLTGRSIPETGTTIFRPPYTPVAIGAFAGRSRGRHYRPTRFTPTHLWSREQGADFIEAGAWLRPRWYARDGETDWQQTVEREARAVRASVGICDVSTLGKIDVQGADAAEFLNRIYCNGFAMLPVGRVRYGIMLREDGMVMDDGTTARLAEDHFITTTTTSNAVAVSRHMEFCHQCLWPDLDVQMTSITDAWAQIAIAGPNARKLLSRVVDDGHDLSNEGFPFMACGEVSVAGGIAARLFRISFSGELAYELAVPARYGNAMMAALMEAGREFDVTPYGVEALSVLRIEKGHPAGGELNGQTTARDLGMGRMVSEKKDSIGAVLSRRDGLTGDDRPTLVGLMPVDRSRRLTGGAHLLARGAEAVAANDQGWVSSVARSPHTDCSIALAFLKGGAARTGEVLRAVDLLGGGDVEVAVVTAHFVDADGARLRS